MLQLTCQGCLRIVQRHRPFHLAVLSRPQIAARIRAQTGHPATKGVVDGFLRLAEQAYGKYCVQCLPQQVPECFSRFAVGTTARDA